MSTQATWLLKWLPKIDLWETKNHVDTSNMIIKVIAKEVTVHTKIHSLWQLIPSSSVLCITFGYFLQTKYLTTYLGRSRQFFHQTAMKHCEDRTDTCRCYDCRYEYGQVGNSDVNTQLMDHEEQILRAIKYQFRYVNKCVSTDSAFVLAHLYVHALVCHLYFGLLSVYLGVVHNNYCIHFTNNK